MSDLPLVSNGDNYNSIGAAESDSKPKGTTWKWASIFGLIMSLVVGVPSGFIFGIYVGVALGLICGWGVALILLLLGTITFRPGVCAKGKCFVFWLIGIAVCSVVAYFLWTGDICAHVEVTPTYIALSTEGDDLSLDFDTLLQVYNPNFIELNTQGARAYLCADEDCSVELDVVEMDDFSIEMQATTTSEQYLAFEVSNATAAYVTPCEEASTTTTATTTTNLPSVELFVAIELDLGASFYSYSARAPGVGFPVPCVPAGTDSDITNVEPYVITLPLDCEIPE